MKPKQMQARGRAVETRVKRLDRDPFTYEVEGEVGGAIIARRMTIGPDRGIGAANYTQEMLQRDLDAFRQKVAEEAVWRAGISDIMDAVE
ncbi:MAG TPA: hypothetical protein VMX97_16590 [Hyphomicrobiaceae bacterium]|nr:hypothetical protein [Hyphomicrobiaceae bacterium]